mgnify:FL=1
MLLQTLRQLYRRLRLTSYRRIFGSIRERSGSLSATEAFSADIIHLLGSPTISQFADTIGISQPNATYKINNLVAKGYVEKVPSPGDRREIRLQPAEKLRKYMERGEGGLEQAVQTLQKTYTDQQLELAARVLTTLLDEVEEEENHDRSV